jgi:hypothetical protein
VALASSKFLSLPLEFVVDNLSCLPPQDIATFQEFVVRCDYSTRSPLLQHRTHKHRVGVEDRFSPNLTLLDCVDHLRRWEEAWGSLDVLNPSGKRIELTARPRMDTQCMLDGFLVLSHFEELRTDAGTAGFSAFDLCSPGWRQSSLII